MNGNPFTTPPELSGLSQEQLRFYRLIEEREMLSDGTQKITLACGHSAVQIVPIRDEQNYMQCAQCVNAWAESERAGMMTRQEHLEWAKRRALEYVDAGRLEDAVASMTSDLRKHPELENHAAASIGLFLLMLPERRPDEIRNWIKGFC